MDQKLCQQREVRSVSEPFGSRERAARITKREPAVTICLLLGLCGRKILGSAAGAKKDAKLVETAFYSVQADLRNIHIFHTDRGSEFKNLVIEQILDAFSIERSLSAKGTPYDNAVAESMYNIVKTKFVFGNHFADLAEFKLYWFDYVNWYNNIRIHGSLDYLTPTQWHNLA